MLKYLKFIILGAVAFAACTKSDDSSQADQFTMDTLVVQTPRVIMVDFDKVYGYFELAFTDGRYDPSEDNFIDDRATVRIAIASPSDTVIVSNTYSFLDFYLTMVEKSVFDGFIDVAKDTVTDENIIYDIISGTMDITNEDPIYEFSYSFVVNQRGTVDTAITKNVSGYYKGRIDRVSNKTGEL